MCTLALVSAFVGVAVAPAASASTRTPPPATIVVNEFAVASSASGADSFFELRNVTDSRMDLSGWSIFRCDERGLRENVGRPEVDLEGVILGPGEIFLATQMSAHITADAVDARFSQLYAQSGLGLVLIGPDGEPADAVAMYPNTPWQTESECAPTPNLPANLAAALDESWQRTDAGDWVRATATPGTANAEKDDPASPPAVRIEELAAAGPAGSDDDFVELHNAGDREIDLSEWALYRCTATGALTPKSLQVDFARGVRLAAGDRLLVAGPGYSGEVEPDFRTSTSLADTVSGVLLVDAERRRVDGVTLSEHADTACQSGDDKLGSSLDYRSGQSWQRNERGEFVVAGRTPGHVIGSPADVATAAAADSPPASVGISEFATDPVITPAPSGIDRSNFVEVANFSATAQDVGGWRIYRCGRDGFLAREPLATIPDDTSLAPGEVWLVALQGTSAAASADATFASAFDFQGAGAWIEDADGRRIDGVGAFHVNEMDRSVDTASLCASGLSLSVFAVDRLRGESYQRIHQSGASIDDFTAAPATPGTFDQPTSEPLETRALTVAESLYPEPRHAAVRSAFHTVTPAGSDIGIREAHVGSAGSALTTFVGEKERAIASPDTASLAAADDGYSFPYVRFAAAVSAPATVQWTGQVLGRSEIRLSVWNEAALAWREVDSASGAESALVEQPNPSAVQLSGEVRGDEVIDGVAWLLVQIVPRTDEGLTSDEQLSDPADYDFAVSHLTDTQYLTEAYPEVYADIVGWVVGSAERRKIAFATHTGDLVQNWVDPDQAEARARHEFEIASRMQSVLDDAGLPNSVLPGNHDSKRGITSDLFNEYFGPERYTGTAWYGGSIAPMDNTANFSTFTAGGARMLMLSLPYAYAEREIAWAEQVVAAHPDANVIISTHEHVTPKTVEHSAGRSNSSRWVSHADQLWQRVVSPHRNVIVVLSGHFHGLGSIVTENAGGIPGHTVLESLADYQEFRTHTGERATGFARLLQFDLGGGRVAVDALSSTLGEMTSFSYDYEQFLPDNGRDSTASNDRPWRILANGLQNRYTAADDHFTADIALQYPKSLTTAAVSVLSIAALPDPSLRGHAAR